MLLRATYICDARILELEPWICAETFLRRQLSYRLRPTTRSSAQHWPGGGQDQSCQLTKKKRHMRPRGRAMLSLANACGAGRLPETSVRPPISKRPIFSGEGGRVVFRNAGLAIRFCGRAAENRHRQNSAETLRHKLRPMSMLVPPKLTEIGRSCLSPLLGRGSKLESGGHRPAFGRTRLRYCVLIGQCR